MAAAAGVSSDVDMGPGWLWAAAVGTAEPADASTALPSAWRTIGYTEDGNTFTSEVTAEDIEVAEELDPIDIRETKRANSLVLQMAQVNRKNLALAFNTGPNEANDNTPYEPPALGASVYCMLAWDLNSFASTDATNVRILYRKCKASGPIAIPHKKAPAKSLIPVTFRIVKPTGLAPFKVFPNASGLTA